MGLNVGAPPDLFNAHGQDWGITSFSPHALRRDNFAPFIATLRANMRHAGGIRIDHILGLARLWLVPNGAGAREGVYLRYPLDDLLRIIALESVRARAIVIGEDLGTVPPGLRERLTEHGVDGMRVLWFERQADGQFADPAAWPLQSVALSSTHDLPTVAGWRAQRDIDWRAYMPPTPDAATLDAERQRRVDDLRALESAMHAERSDATPDVVEAQADHLRADRLPSQRWASADLDDAAQAQVARQTFLRTVFTHMARAGSRLLILPLEDVFGVVEQPNIPGTIDEHPNWRRRIGPSCSFDDPDVQTRLSSVQRLRASAP